VEDEGSHRIRSAAGSKYLYVCLVYATDQRLAIGAAGVVVGNPETGRMGKA
jgi:hypothetical protein